MNTVGGVDSSPGGEGGAVWLVVYQSLGATYCN